MTLNDPSTAGTAPDATEEIHEEVEIEVYGKQNVRPPKAKRYVIRIDKVKYTVDVTHMTGRQLLELAGKTCPFGGGQVAAFRRSAPVVSFCGRDWQGGASWSVGGTGVLLPVMVWL